MVRLIQPVQSTMDREWTYSDSSRLRRLCTRFLFCSDGASLPETAVLIVSVLALVALGAGLTGVQMGDALGEISRTMGGQAPADRPLHESGKGPAAEFPTKVVAASDATHSERTLLLLTIVALALCVGILSRRPKGEKKLQDRAPSSIPTHEPQSVFEKRQQILRILSNDIRVLFEGRIAVHHLMTRDPVTVGLSQRVGEASDLMDEHGIDYLLVCDKNGSLVGLLSRFYLKRSSASKVSEAMAKQPPCIPPDALLSPTVTQMINRRVSCVVVVVEQRPVGILTTTDIQLAMQCALQLLFKATADKDHLPA